QVVHRLSAIFVAVDHHPVTLFGQALVTRIRRDGKQQASQQFGLLGRSVVQGGNRLARNEQHVRGCLRIDIGETHDVFILIHDIGGNFVTQDLGKNRVGHRLSPVLKRYRERSRLAAHSYERVPNACASVERSTYSNSPPTGTPCVKCVV